MLCQDVRTMRPFRDRLREAAAYAGIAYSPTTIGRALGVAKQTVHPWMGDGEPRAAMVFRIADLWGVNPRWLATEEGAMVQEPPSSGLTLHELEILRRYRTADPQWRQSLRMMAKAAAKVAVALALAVQVLLPTPAEAALSRAQLNNNTDCMRFLRRWLRSLRGHLGFVKLGH
jgi:hypothetical protein